MIRTSGRPAAMTFQRRQAKSKRAKYLIRATNSRFQIPLIRGREVVEFPANQELFTRRYTEEAVKWISTHKDESFFLYMAHNMPHAPVFASKMFQGKSAAGRYGDVIEEIDWSVGEVLRALAEAEIDRKTLVVFHQR